MKLYFYKKTICPEEYDYYDHTHGIVGYKQPNPVGVPIGHMTEEELHQRRNRRATKQPAKFVRSGMNRMGGRTL